MVIWILLGPQGLVLDQPEIWNPKMPEAGRQPLDPSLGVLNAVSKKTRAYQQICKLKPGLRLSSLAE